MEIPQVLEKEILYIGVVGSDACGTFSSSGIYTLTTNVSSTGTCFTVTAANVTIDCNGNWITYSTGEQQALMEYIQISLIRQ